jgi:MFS family permease
VLGANMLGTCGLFCALPLLARLGGGGAARQVRVMAATLTVCGFFQGPLIPGQQVMRRNWLPKPGSPERPIHMKLISLGGQFSGLLASTVTPMIAGAFGWRAVNAIMGGGGLVLALAWFGLAKSEPTQFRKVKFTGLTQNSQVDPAV